MGGLDEMGVHRRARVRAPVTLLVPNEYGVISAPLRSFCHSILQ
jgi:hypothetical protein